MTKQLNLQNNNTTYQLKLPVEILTIIEISASVYAFCEFMDCIDLRKYLTAPESGTGRKRCNSEILLRVTKDRGRFPVLIGHLIWCVE